MRVVSDRASLAEARRKLTGRVGVVMTMGALHAGHAALLAAARDGGDHLVCTIFVNPLQFGPNEDLDRYPRTLDADLEVCAEHGADLVFAPTRDVVYPSGDPVVRVNPGPLGEILEGASRPGFFHGVLTVVLKLLHLTVPDLAYFGEKDYQQLTLVRRMVRDLDLPTEIVGVPTVREPDGLALSSRNSYLSTTERDAALTLSRTLHAGQAAAAGGAEAALAAAREVYADAGFDLPAVGAETGFDLPAAGAGPGSDAPAADAERRREVDYLALTDPELGLAPAAGRARLLTAARVGRTRLIDNVALEVGGAGR